MFILLTAHSTVANKFELLKIVQRRGNLAMAKSLHRQDVLFKVRGIAAYMDKGVYNVAVEGVLESTAREVCITFHY